MPERQIAKPKWMTEPRTPPWVPVMTYTSKTVEAFKAVWAGEGTPEQQRMVLEFTIEHLSAYGEISHRSESTHDTAFAEGRRFVGQQMQKLIGLKGHLVAKLREKENAGHATSNTGDTTDRER